MNKESWDSLVIERSGEFLQSWQWGEFEESLGHRVERIYQQNFCAQVVFKPLPFNLNYGYIPRGPLILKTNKGESTNKEELFQELETAKDSQTVFFELELEQPISFLAPLAPDTRQPQQTSILSLLPTKKDLWSGLHKKHRASIRLAENDEIEFRKESDWQPFFELLSLTATHRQFRVWPESYYAKIWQLLAPAGMVEIWSAYEGERIVASNLYILFGKRATHLFGGSDPARRSLMAPHALHWHVIKSFKDRNVLEYDFWGVDENRWPGLTRFKERFGGKRVSYPGTYLKPTRPAWYTIYKLARKF